MFHLLRRFALIVCIVYPSHVLASCESSFHINIQHLAKSHYPKLGALIVKMGRGLNPAFIDWLNHQKDNDKQFNRVFLAGDKVISLMIMFKVNSSVFVTHLLRDPDFNEEALAHLLRDEINFISRHFGLTVAYVDVTGDSEADRTLWSYAGFRSTTGQDEASTLYKDIIRDSLPTQAFEVFMNNTIIPRLR